MKSCYTSLINSLKELNLFSVQQHFIRDQNNFDKVSANTKGFRKVNKDGGSERPKRVSADIRALPFGAASEWVWEWEVLGAMCFPFVYYT